MGYNVKIFTSSRIHNTNINIIKKNEEVCFKSVLFNEVEYIFLKNSDYAGNNFLRIRNMLEFALKVLRYLSKTGVKHFGIPNIIYTSSPCLLASFASVKLAKKLDVPIITEIRDLWPESIVCYKNISKKNPVIIALYKIESWIYKNSNKIIFTFEGGNNYLKEKKISGIDFKKIHHINNGVDLQEFNKNMSNVVEDKDLLNDKTFKIIYTGSIREVNNLSILIEVAKNIKNKFKNIRFLVYGSGNQKKELEERCKKENIDNVIFKGNVSYKYLPFILSKGNANIIVVKQTKLMRFGSSFNKLFDYMASKKPVISNLKVNYDLIQRYKCGVSAVLDDLKALEEAIEKIYNLSNYDYKNMCRNAGNAVKNYDYKVLSKKLHKILESLSS
jgi:glycosyltransferase involved in cell wall biosynthesis